MRLNLGSLPPLKQLLPRLRWYASQGYEQLGPAPLAIAAIWLMLLFYVCAQLRPALTAETLQLQSIQQQLAVPLPISSTDLEDAEDGLSATEYEQVKALFAILKKHGLTASEGHYQLLLDGQDAQRDRLILNIPLTGDYLHLQNALREMAASLPLQFESLGMARSSPATTQLAMSLRIALIGEAP